METIDLTKLFWIVNFILWAFLLLVVLIMGNAAILRRRGYDESYIAFMRKDYIIRSVVMAFAIPAIQIAAYFVVKLFVKDISSRPELVLLVFICMVIPFAVIDHISTRKKLKLLNEKTTSVLVVDLKHKVLNLVYNPVFEIILTVFTVTYALVIAKPVVLFYLHIILPWVFYFTARSSRKTARPHLKYGYLWAFVFITLNFILVLYYLTNSLLTMRYQYSSYGILLGIFLIVVLAARIVYYLINYPLLRQRLQGKN